MVSGLAADAHTAGEPSRFASVRSHTSTTVGPEGLMTSASVWRLSPFVSRYMYWAWACSPVATKATTGRRKERLFTRDRDRADTISSWCRCSAAGLPTPGCCTPAELLLSGAFGLGVLPFFPDGSKA